MYNSGLRDAPTTALCTLTADMPAARWHKLLWNGTFNTLCSLMRMDVGELQSSRGRETLLIPMVRKFSELFISLSFKFKSVSELPKALLALSPLPR